MISLTTELYDHQSKAVEKLEKIKIGALYMEMGTGKTRTALELVAKRYNAGKVNHILWLCPCSVKGTIQRELKKHINENDLLMFTICGIETLSSSISENVRLLDLVQDKDVYIIVDESNLVKNPKAKRTENITRLAEYCQYKLILNGTPVSRTEADLFAQWYLLDWRILGYRSFWSFARNHVVWDEAIRGRIKDIVNIDYIVRRIAPYSYQVKKEECLDLPDKTHRTFYYDLDEEQYQYYMEVAERLMFEVEELKPHTIYRLFAGLQNVISGFKVVEGSAVREGHLFKNPRDNPRVNRLLDALNFLSQDKSIIFCKYTQEIKDLVTVLNEDYGDGAALPFYGEINQKQRQQNIDTFYKSARFLVANKTTAGYGLNLQFCNNVIYYNNDWDYATRSQSEDRVYRIGQEHKVTIIDICAEETLDERILACLWRKENMVEAFKNSIEQQKNKKVVWDWIKGRGIDG